MANTRARGENVTYTEVTRIAVDEGTAERKEIKKLAPRRTLGLFITLTILLFLVIEVFGWMGTFKWMFLLTGAFILVLLMVLNNLSRRRRLQYLGVALGFLGLGAGLFVLGRHLDAETTDATRGKHSTVVTAPKHEDRMAIPSPPLKKVCEGEVEKWVLYPDLDQRERFKPPTGCWYGFCYYGNHPTPPKLVARNENTGVELVVDPTGTGAAPFVEWRGAEISFRLSSTGGNPVRVKGILHEGGGLFGGDYPCPPARKA